MERAPAASARRVVVTGANGVLGRALLRDLAARPDAEPVAAVRSRAAAQRVAAAAPGAACRVVDYGDPSSLTPLLKGAWAVVHLVGILRESATSRYAEAHEASAAALARAAREAACPRIVYISLLGAEPGAANPCLASKGRAEALLLEAASGAGAGEGEGAGAGAGAAATTTTVLQLPMVIGGGDPASRALRRRAGRRALLLLGGGRHCDQPIDVRDAIAAIRSALERPPGGSALRLAVAGPESLSYRELLLRCAALRGGRPRPPRIGALPVAWARAAAALAERCIANPPLTRAMLDVLLRDDRVDPEPACRAHRDRVATPRRNPARLDRERGHDPMSAASPPEPPGPGLGAARGRGRGRRLLAGLPWLIALLCFAFLASRIQAAAQAEGISAAALLARVFAHVAWGPWLLLMSCYSLLYCAIDTLVVWRVINWFHARVAYRDIMPVRISAYILSILNEQVGKGAMALYLHRREGTPGFEVASSMLFIMVCEFYYLLGWALLALALGTSPAPGAAGWVLGLAAVSLPLLAAVSAALRRGRLDRALAKRPRIGALLHSFRRAPLRYYGTVVLLRSPAMAAAIFVYAWALALFGVEVSPRQVLGVLPLIFFSAALPIPLRAVASSLWVALFPGRPAELAAFGFAMHNFFIFANASLGLLFVRRAQRELFPEAPEAASHRERGGGDEQPPGDSQ